MHSLCACFCQKLQKTSVVSFMCVSNLVRILCTCMFMLTLFFVVVVRSQRLKMPCLTTKRSS
jgi:hypothetical protein